MNGWLRLPVAAVAFAWLTGCGLFGGGESKDADRETATAKPQVVRYEGEPSKALPFVYTSGKELALTFNGLADDKTMLRLLGELDKYNIKATFFVPGMRVAEEPELAKEIVSRGHEIENNTLSRLDMTKLGYQQIDDEIRLGNEVIERETGVTPRYVRTKSGDYNDDVRLAAAHNGMDAVVVYSLFLHNWKGESEREKYVYVRKYITRGGIIAVDTEEFDDVVGVVPIIAEAVKEVGYRLILLDELVKHGGERKPLEQLPGHDAIRLNPDYRNAQYNLVYDHLTDKKEIALTFDDWGTDYTITRILEILDRYGVKATFFARAKGVEANPNLARAIVEEGHEIANHSYSHPVVTTLTPKELQEEVVKGYQVIMEAIQQQPTMLFRPPTGEIDDETARIIAATGYKNIALYDVTTFDWDVNNDADHIVNAILEQTEKGSVILLHMLDDIHTLEALPVAIERLQAQGYTFVKMGDWLGLQP